MNFHDYLIQAKNGSLPMAAAEAAFDAILDGQAEAADIGRFLIMLAERGESAGELVGLARSLRRHAASFAVPGETIDVCGTGGDGGQTPNISTAVGFVVAGCGVPVAKHGNRAVSSRSGSADVLEALGVKIDAAPELSRRALLETNICFLFAPFYHPAMRHVSAVRRELGRRTIFNLAGPLANPASPRRQLIGVYSRDWLRPMAETLHLLGSGRAWIVHGRDGLDEISTMALTEGVDMNGGEMTSFTIDPAEYGLQLNEPEQLKGGDAAVNAATIMKFLQGTPGVFHDIVVVNAAAALVIAGRAANMREGIAAAKDSVADGRARAALEALVAITNEKP
ncbi:MAG: anthranilate phosphoribosyltransferase [Alphaproteobacteria bacterium]